MNPLKKYKDNDNNIYTIENIDHNNISKHCDQYFDFISLSTNTDFHPTELINHYMLMQKAIDLGLAFSVKYNGVEDCFLYAVKESTKLLNVIVMFSNEKHELAITKLLMINYLYNTKLFLRYTPKDIYTLPQSSLFDKYSLSVLRANQTETIKFSINNIFDDDIISYLNLKEI